MTEPVAPARKRLPVAKLAVAAVVLGAGLVLVLRGVHLKPLADQGMGLIRTVGPWTFFTLLAVAPAAGAPLSAFTLTAGEAFSRQMTMTGVVLAVLAAVVVNLAFTYWLARYAMRPALSRLVERYGYSIPRANAENSLSIILLLRLTPGPPFFLQSYLLGLAEVPFRLYMVASLLCISPWVIAFVVLGKGIFNGDFKLLMYGVGVVVAATAGFHLLRNRYGKRSA
jgi:uncharacterized membrane protein YdjX (TVP38/TMEM64 family)